MNNIVDSVIVKNGDMIEAVNMHYTEDKVVYRVPDDAEKALLLISSDDTDVVIKAADNVFSGKDPKYYSIEPRIAAFLDLNTYIQRSGEYKGCVVIESVAEPFESCLLVFEK